MRTLSQIRNCEPERRIINREGLVDTLMSALRETEGTLWESIWAEEERTSVRDLNDPCYSRLARSMRARANNIRATIATLETACPAA
jgi:hypothetical protein